ncbi:MAG: peptide ABC transporter substrate-binding protein [Tumebacillaceae bacterium]
MNKKIWFGTAMSAIVMSSVLVGCGSSGDKQGATGAQELNLAIGDDVPSLDLAKATDAYSLMTISNTMEGLTRLDKDGKPQPGIASSWDISKDGMTYTFHLRDTKWSNGDAVSAKDFVYSYLRTLDPATGSQYAYMLSYIKGADEFTNKKGTKDQVGVKALDDKTLQITLKAPTPFFLAQTAFPTYFPMDQKFVESKGKNYATSPDTVITDGPFKVTDWQHDTSLTLQNNADYWDAKSVKLTKVTFSVVKDSNTELNMYESGELDRAGLVRDQVDNYKNKKDEYNVVPELTNGYLIFNEKVKGLDNAKVRTALTWAVDRDMYADIVYHNGTVGATGFVPTGTLDSAGGDFRKDAGDLLTKHTPAEAKALLAEGLKEAGIDPAKFSFHLQIDDTDVAKKAAEFLQEQWNSKLGVKPSIDAMPFKLRLDNEKKKNYQVGISLWGADYNDAMTFLDLWTSTGEFNSVGYNSPAYDKLITDAKNNPDVKSRAQQMVDAEKLLMKDMPVGPIFFRSRAFAMKPYVKDFYTYPSGVDYSFKYTHIEGK